MKQVDCSFSNLRNINRYSTAFLGASWIFKEQNIARFSAKLIINHFTQSPNSKVKNQCRPPFQLVKFQGNSNSLCDHFSDLFLYFEKRKNRYTKTVIIYIYTYIFLRPIHKRFPNDFNEKFNSNFNRKMKKKMVIFFQKISSALVDKKYLSKSPRPTMGKSRSSQLLGKKRWNQKHAIECKTPNDRKAPYLKLLRMCQENGHTHFIANGLLDKQLSQFDRQSKERSTKNSKI